MPPALPALNQGHNFLDDAATALNRETIFVAGAAGASNRRHNFAAVAAEIKHGVERSPGAAPVLHRKQNLRRWRCRH